MTKGLAVAPSDQSWNYQENQILPYSSTAKGYRKSPVTFPTIFSG